MTALRSITLLCLIATCLWSQAPASLAANQQPVGQVLISLGKNQAIAPDGKARKLKRKSPLFAGDKIQTSTTGRVQVRFSDGSMVSIQADTEFVVETYQFDKQAPNDGQAVYRLLKGGMRTLTGLIGREEKEDYRLETPVASIGIRGTLFSLYYCNASCAARSQHQQGLFGSVVRGGIQVGNQAGSHALGADEHFYLASAQSNLQPLLAPPEILREDSDAETQEAPEESEAKDEDSEATDEAEDNQSAESEESESTEAGAETAESAGSKEAGEADDSAGSEPSAAEGEESASPAEQREPQADTGADATTDAGPSRESQPAPTPAFDDTQQNSFGDRPLSNDPALQAAQPDSEPSITLAAIVLQESIDTTDPTAGSTTTESNPQNSTGDSTGPTEPTDPGTSTPPSTITAAPDGAALAVSATKNDPNGFFAGGTGFLTGATASVTIDQIEGADNIPVQFEVYDTPSPAYEMPCNPCSFSAGDAVLVDVGGLSGPGEGINWGRWQGAWSLSVNGAPEAMQENLHFIYSPNLTPQALRKSLTGSFVYHMAGGTQPTDELGNLGQYLPTYSFVNGQYQPQFGFIDIDFSNQVILGIDFNFSIGDRSVHASQLHRLVPLGDLMLDGGIALRGFCYGGTCDGVGGEGIPLMGDLGLAFVGDSAQRILSSWGLFEDAPNSRVAFNGVAAFEQAGSLPASTFSYAPPGTLLSLAFIEHDMAANHQGATYQLHADVDTAIITDTLGLVGNVPVYAAFDATGGAGPECPNCQVSAGQAALLDTGGLDGPDMGVNWGRWNGDWAITGDQPDPARPGDSLHFIYSPNRTPDATVQSLTGSFTYNLAGGTRPTDESGFSGDFVGSNRIDVDFSTQTITDVQLTMQINGRDFSATQSAPTAISHILSRGQIDLNGVCSGGSCGNPVDLVGKMGVDFIGPNAERIASGFGLQENAPNPGVAVSGAAVFERPSSP